MTRHITDSNHVLYNKSLPLHSSFFQISGFKPQPTLELSGGVVKTQVLGSTLRASDSVGLEGSYKNL